MRLQHLSLAAEILPSDLQEPLHLRQISALRQPLKTPPSLRPELFQTRDFAKPQLGQEPPSLRSVGRSPLRHAAPGRRGNCGMRHPSLRKVHRIIERGIILTKKKYLVYCALVVHEIFGQASTGMFCNTLTCLSVRLKFWRAGNREDGLL